MLGVNGFFDYEIQHNHMRDSIGIEYRNAIFSMFYNKYYKVSDTKQNEEVLEGNDYYISGIMPYLSWINLVYKGYEWYNNKGKDYSMEMLLHPNIELVFGADSNKYYDKDTASYVKLNVTFPRNLNHKNAMSEKFISNSAWNLREDIFDFALAKVRRTNKIMLKNTGVITIGYGNK